MTINLRILVPEATTNYVLNPQLRYATTGWTAVGSTITRNLDYARFGIASLKVVTNGAALKEGTFYRVSSLLGVTDQLTVSAYVRGTGKVRIRMIDNPSGREFLGEPESLNPDRFLRLSVSGLISGTAAGNDVRLYVETADTTPRAITFYVDGAQMERKPYATSYCDGDQPGCRWNIINSASTSTRTGDTRLGGRWVNLAGPCRDNNDLYVTVLGGMGVAPLTNQIQPFALAPGSFYQGYKIQNRVVTWNFYAKQESKSPTPSLNPLHELRQQLIDIIKPDKTIGGESFLLEYSDDEGVKPLYCNFRYEAGLEGEWDIRNGWFNSFPVRMIAVDPFWYEDNQNVQQLGIKTTYPGTQTTVPFWSFESRMWKKLADIDLGVTCIKEGYDGTIYICGSIYGRTQGKIYKWDGAALTLLGSTNVLGFAIIADMDISTDGNIYITGTFNGIGAVAAAYAAKYNIATGVWSALGSGLGGAGWAVCVAQNGQVYFGGAFLTINGAAITATRIGRWDGGQWGTVGATSGVNNTVLSIVRGIDNSTLYMGGNFTLDRALMVNVRRVARIDITTNLITEFGTGNFPLGGSNGLWKIVVGLDGVVYAGGDFTLTLSGDTVSNRGRVGKCSGGSWSAVGQQFNASPLGTATTVWTMAIGKNGELYVGGTFPGIGNTPAFNTAKWVDGAWNPIELGTTGNVNYSVQGMLVSRKGDLFVGSVALNIAFAYSTSIPYYNTITNQGSNAVFPLLYVAGQGTVRCIANVKTGEAIYLNLPVFTGEEVYIDFARGEITSTIRGSLLYTILPGSEIRGINLLPDDNQIAILITDEVGCVCQMRYIPQHWSVDSIIDAAVL